MNRNLHWKTIITMGNRKIKALIKLIYLWQHRRKYLLLKEHNLIFSSNLIANNNYQSLKRVISYQDLHKSVFKHPQNIYNQLTINRQLRRSLIQFRPMSIMELKLLKLTLILTLLQNKLEILNLEPLHKKNHTKSKVINIQLMDKDKEQIVLQILIITEAVSQIDTKLHHQKWIWKDRVDFSVNLVKAL